MIKQIKKSIQVIILGLFVGIGVQFVYSAWNGPGSNPPSGNKPAPINVSSTAQGKGGVPTSGSLLDIHGVLAANQLGIAGDSIFGDLVTVTPLGDSTRVNPVPLCADENGSFVLCSSTGNTQVYTLNSSGSQVTSGDCVICTPTQFMNPYDQTVTVRLWAGGGGGGAGGKPYMTCPSGSACSNFSQALSVYTSNFNAAIGGNSSYYFKSLSGASGSDSLFGTLLTARGGVGGSGGGPVCVVSGSSTVLGRCSGNETMFYIAESDGLGGSSGTGGAGSPGLQGLLDDVPGTNPLQIPTVASIGGSGGGGESGEFVEQTFLLPAGTYSVVVGKGGNGGNVIPSSFASGLNGNQTSCDTSQTRSNDSFFIKKAHAQIGTGGPTGTKRNGGAGGVPPTVSGAFGRGGTGGATENCEEVLDSTGSAYSSKANHGASGNGGRIEIIWGQ